MMEQLLSARETEPCLNFEGAFGFLRLGMLEMLSLGVMEQSLPNEPTPAKREEVVLWYDAKEVFSTDFETDGVKAHDDGSVRVAQTAPGVRRMW